MDTQVCWRLTKGQVQAHLSSQRHWLLLRFTAQGRYFYTWIVAKEPKALACYLFMQMFGLSLHINLHSVLTLEYF